METDMETDLPSSLSPDDIKLLKLYGANDNWIESLIENGLTLPLILDLPVQNLRRKGLKIEELKTHLNKYDKVDSKDNQIIPLPSEEDKAIIHSGVMEAMVSYQEKSAVLTGVAIGTSLVIKNAMSVGRVFGRANIGIAVATTIISIGIDVYGWYLGEYSGRMLARKVTNTIASGVGGFVGGGLGALIGGAVGSLLGPIGTVIGALVGGAIGGYYGGNKLREASDKFTSGFWSDEDEAKYHKKLSYLKALETFSDKGLKLSEDVSDAILDSLKREYSLKYHPDRPGGDREMFIVKMTAYETIVAYRKAEREGKLGCIHKEDIKTLVLL